MIANREIEIVAWLVLFLGVLEDWILKRQEQPQHQRDVDKNKKEDEIFMPDTITAR